jgi:hypothetical protein
MGDLLSGEKLAEPPKVTATAICNHFAQAYLEADGYACMFEVSNGTGSNARTRADILVMNLWPSRGHELHGYEVKVSRSDWQSELRQPDKAWPVMQFCDRWFLVSAPGVAKMDEIPVNWGWQEFDGEKLRVRKAAPTLEPKPLSRSFIGAMLRKPIRDVEAMARDAAAKRSRELEKDFKARVASEVERRVKDADEALQKIAAIKVATGIDLMDYSVNDETVAAALKFATSEKPFQRYNGLPSAINSVQAAMNHLQALARRLEEFVPKEAS